jgi:hypothetical protein
VKGGARKGSKGSKGRKQGECVMSTVIYIRVYK